VVKSENAWPTDVSFGGWAKHSLGFERTAGNMKYLTGGAVRTLTTSERNFATSLGHS